MLFVVWVGDCLLFDILWMCVCVSACHYYFYRRVIDFVGETLPIPYLIFSKLTYVSQLSTLYITLIVCAAIGIKDKVCTCR